MSYRTKNAGFIASTLGTLALALTLTLIASPAVAQEQATNRPHVTISGSSGYMMGGPASGIEAMLQAGGFGDILQGGCVLTVCREEEDYPTTRSDPGPASNVRVAYSQWSHLEFAFSMGTATPSLTSGYSQVLVPDFGRFSEVESHLRMLAPTAGMRWRFVGVGGGPAYYKLRTWVTDEDEIFDEFKTSKIGGVLEADGQFVMFKKLILELRVQYRFVGATDMGPLQAESRTLPVTPVDFSHAYFGVGLGLAF